MVRRPKKRSVQGAFGEVEALKSVVQFILFFFCLTREPRVLLGAVRIGEVLTQVFVVPVALSIAEDEFLRFPILHICL